MAFPSTWRLDVGIEMENLGSEVSGTSNLSRLRTACGCGDCTLPRQLIRIQPNLESSVQPLFHPSQ